MQRKKQRKEPKLKGCKRFLAVLATIKAVILLITEIIKAIRNL